MSPDSMESVVCNMELDYAIELRKRIVPLVYQEIETRDAFASIADFEPDQAMEERLAGKDPLIIARDNWQRLSHINWVFFRDEDDFDIAFDKLVETVDTDLEYVKAHTRYLTRSQEWLREDRRSDLLLFGQEIDRAEAWLVKGNEYAAQADADSKVEVVNPLPQDNQREYIAESRVADRRRKRLARSAQVSIAVLIVVLVVGGLVSAAIVSNTQQEVANVQATSTRSVADANEQVFIAGETLTPVPQTLTPIPSTLTAAAQQVETSSAQVFIAGETLTPVPPTLTKVAQEVQAAQNFANSLRLSALGQDVYTNLDPFIGLSLVLEASLIDNSPQTERALSQLAYEPGALQRFEGHTDDVESVALSPDGETALSGSMDTTLILWDVKRGEVIRRFEGHTNTVNSVVFSPNGETALSGSLDSTLILWDLAVGEVLQRFEGHDDWVNSVAFSPNGEMALSGSWDNTLILWDVASGRLLQRFEDHTAAVVSVAFGPDGQTAVSGSDDRTLILWDVASGELLQRFEGHTDAVLDVAFSPDGQTILSGSFDNTLILWDATSGKVLRRFEGHAGSVNGVAFSPDGQTALSGSGDNTLILWDVASSELLRRFEGHTNIINSVAFSPDGQTALSGSWDNTLILWRIDSSDQLQQWTRDNRYVPTLNCEQRIIYDVPDKCVDGELPPTPTFVPTRTPFPQATIPVWTPIGTPTITPSQTETDSP